MEEFSSLKGKYSGQKVGKTEIPNRGAGPAIEIQKEEEERMSILETRSSIRVKEGVWHFRLPKSRNKENYLDHKTCYLGLSSAVIDSCS